MPVFRVALTGDFLNESGAVAYGDAGLDLLAGRPDVRWHFITDLAPQAGRSRLLVAALFAGSRARAHPGRRRPGRAAALGEAEHVRRRAPATSFVIGRSGAGYDKIDLAACTEHGVAVFNAPLALNHSTASSALLFMLALAKRLPEQERITRQGRWDLQADGDGQRDPGPHAGHRRPGAQRPRAGAAGRLRSRCGSSPIRRTPTPSSARSLGVRLTSLEEVLRESDFVSLHCRLTEATRGLITAGQLALMKPTAYFINVGRGELVDQQALADALRDRRIAGAGLDVFEVEPLPLDDPLLGLDNVILTPHWSASTSDVWRRPAGRWPRECSGRRAARSRRTSSTRRCSIGRVSARNWRDSREKRPRDDDRESAIVHR